ncbi:MAG: alpha/beta hydrolase [Leptospirales bacterium]|nr:alpha/beta hydrolase [Leptospirales bacterium]
MPNFIGMIHLAKNRRLAGLLTLGAAILFAGCSFSLSRGDARAALAPEVEPQFLSSLSDGLELHYVSAGRQDLPPLVFLHGSPGSWSGYLDYLKDRRLLERFHLIAIDRPGFGESTPGHAEPSLQRQAAAIAPILQRWVSAGRSIVLGHSFGGPVAVRLAMDHPQLVRALVLVAGSIDPDQEERRWFNIAARYPPLRLVLPGDWVVSNDEIWPLKEELQKMLPLWPRLQVPVTVIQGGADDLVPPANADFAARMLPAQQLHLVRPAEATHFVLWEDRELVVRQILALAH